ncbi:glycosyltransferase [Nocardiopsis flavescens]|uniref:glycosyltransferase n=1 Tax=Nocardiopsis flavescens TaxID=758803 RepID=UPI003660E628
MRAEHVPEELPRARCVRPGVVAALAAVCLSGFFAWGAVHLVVLVRHGFGADTGLGLVWIVCFALLWWVPLAWLERPLRATPEQAADLDRLVVTVQVPVYNEDPRVLEMCLRSVLEQSRRVDRVRVVDDGSADPGTGAPVDYADIRDRFLERASAAGVEATWDRTPNRGKRYAQMHVLAADDADVFVTLDSDSVMDRHAVREGLAPFADPRVQSVAGHVVVLNRDANVLTRMTGLLYLPFTRGLRSAQSVLRRVTINSGTLAFYRAHLVRDRAGVYEKETFLGRPMQMNDDSMLTFYALLEGDTVHQPSSLVFTLVPERAGHYFGQQLRWMRGTTVRHLWWLRYMPVRGVVFWGTVLEYVHLFLGYAIPLMILAHPGLRSQAGEIALAALVIGAAVGYLISLRIFTIVRSDETVFQRFLLFLLAPMATVWRLLLLRPLYLYAMLTCGRVAQWGTRDRVEVALPAGAAGR